MGYFFSDVLQTLGRIYLWNSYWFLKEGTYFPCVSKVTNAIDISYLTLKYIAFKLNDCEHQGYPYENIPPLSQGSSSSANSKMLLRSFPQSYGPVNLFLSHWENRRAWKFHSYDCHWNTDVLVFLVISSLLTEGKFFSDS